MLHAFRQRPVLPHARTQPLTDGSADYEVLASSESANE
jgi:hypothetical protein